MDHVLHSTRRIMTTTVSAPPLLSIGLPVYNGMPYLESTLESLRSESLDGIEFVVCDNASTDDSWDLIRDVAAADSRFRCFRNDRNIGASRNYNRVFELAAGEYFRWSASDDLISANAITQCMDALQADPTLFLAFPETHLIDENDVVIGEHDDGDGWDSPSVADRFCHSLTQWCYCNVVLGVMRRSVLRKSMLMRDYPASDLVLQANLAVLGRFQRIKGEYYYRRIHSRCTNALNAEALAQFYEPERTTSFTGKHLRMFRDLSAVVWHAQAAPSEKRRMIKALARQMYWYRNALGAEAAALLKLRRRAS